MYNRLLLSTFFLLLAATGCAPEKTKAHPKFTSAAALEELLRGNERFISNQPIHKNLSQEARESSKEGQTPFAAIVGCSDARVPPEIIFDQGLGDLFVIRDAGNVIGPIELDSVEFAAEKLQVPLVVVMGHENCGAIGAALKGPGYIPELEAIYPLIEPALKDCALSKDPMRLAVECNAKHAANDLRSTPLLARLIQQGQLRIVAAYYDLGQGKVTILSED